MGKYDLSLSPIKVGKLTLKNRYAAGSVTSRFALYNDKGGYSSNGIDFEVSRARGGFGLIITGSNYGDQTVDPFDPLNDKPSPLYAPKVSGSTFKTVARRTHQYGSKIFLQIAFGPGRMRNGKAPSVLPTLKDPSKYTTELTIDEIERLIEGAVKLAKYAKANGFDGIEIHAHFGYLLDQFAMKCTNLRTDEYGGDLDGRLTVYRKMIRGIKDACGEDFPIAIRMGTKTYMKSFTEGSLTGDQEFGRDIDETVEIAKKLESYGVDLLDMNAGTYEAHYYCVGPYYMPKGYNISLCKKVKDAVNIPVFCVGLMDDPDMAEKAIADGYIDGITICRAAMIEPNYVRKLAEGREEDIRPCIQCEACEHSNLSQGAVFCSAHPAAMNEKSFGIFNTATPRHVAVIGGGVAGMCAAHTAAVAGHYVDIYEKNEKLGGHLNLIGNQPFKSGVAKLNQWYQIQLAKLNVNVHTSSDMTPLKIKSLGADIVILALGSTAKSCTIHGANKANVVSSETVLSGTAKLGKKVAVIGGGCVGSEIAYTLTNCKDTHDVVLIESKTNILSNKLLSDDVRQMLSELLVYDKVNIRTGTEAVQITDAGVIVEKSGVKETIEADTIVLATGVESSPSMYDELMYSGFEIYEIGDGVQPGTILTASAQAYEIARDM